MNSMVLNRFFNPATMMWERKGFVSLPDELVSKLFAPDADGVTLLYVLCERDKLKELWGVKE